MTLPRIRLRKRILRDLIRCTTRQPDILYNPTRPLCDEAAQLIVQLELALRRARRGK